MDQRDAQISYFITIVPKDDSKIEMKHIRQFLF